MTVRPFDWRDLPALNRFRTQSVFLDSALLLTRGQLMVPGAVFSFMAPAMGVFTCVYNDVEVGTAPIFGQFIHFSGSPFSHLTFLTPDKALQDPSVPALVEYMMTLSGDRGALRLLAEVDENAEAFEALRRCSFVIYSRQRIWRLIKPKQRKSRQKTWRSAISRDATAIRSLYYNLVPGLVQQIEPLASKQPSGLVYFENNNLLAYIELKYGHCGIWVQPFFHPDAQDVPVYLLDLLLRIPIKQTRPVYICIRSYQSWLEPAIEDLGAEPGERQAVMAKQLVAPIKATKPIKLSSLETGQAEITAPMTHIKLK